MSHATIYSLLSCSYQVHQQSTTSTVKCVSVTITDGGGRRPMIRPSSDMHATRVTNFVPNPLVSERFSPTQPHPGACRTIDPVRLSGTKARLVDSTRK